MPLRTQILLCHLQLTDLVLRLYSLKAASCCLVLHLHMQWRRDTSNEEEIISFCISFKDRENVFQKLPSFSVYLKPKLNPSPVHLQQGILLGPLRIHSAGLGLRMGERWTSERN